MENEKTTKNLTTFNDISDRAEEILNFLIKLYESQENIKVTYKIRKV